MAKKPAAFRSQPGAAGSKSPGHSGCKVTRITVYGPKSGKREYVRFVYVPSEAAKDQTVAQ